MITKLWFVRVILALSMTVSGFIIPNPQLAIAMVVGGLIFQSINLSHAISINRKLQAEVREAERGPWLE